MSSARPRDSRSERSSGHFAEVAVAAPLQGALTYRIPERWLRLCRPGVGVRVPIGKRTTNGVVLEVHERAPSDFEVRDIEEVLDPEPQLTADLLALARFLSEYYLSPIGEVLKAMTPETRPSRRVVRLTNQGALALPRSENERRIVSLLLERGPSSVSELVAEGALDGSAASSALAELAREGRVVVEQSGGRAHSRIERAVELAAPLDTALLERCGRSPKARDVVEALHELGRPVTVREITAAVGCGRTVVTRLIRLGVLREFSQLRPLSVERHLLGHATNASGRVQLRPDQAQAADRLRRAVLAREFASYFLGGVTGSGKTEVYVRAIETALELGRGAIVMVPEIAMVPALARTLRARFGALLALLHSNLGEAERRQEWERLRSGEAMVAVGPRSAVFAPIRDLGVVVVDEEHDPAYKQDRTPRYNGRDVALVRARDAGAVVVLVSATPSLETRRNVRLGRFRSLELVERVGTGGVPRGIVVDLRRERTSYRPGEAHFSERLLEEIRACADAGEQMILLRNRRGYAPTLLCRACGEDHRCPECGLPRTLHRRPSSMICHYCGSRTPVPSRCERCGEEALEAIGAGTQRVEDRFRELFPDIPVAVLDRDAGQRRGGAAAILEGFRTGATRALIGTQMVAKGHHFPNVSLAAVLNADSYLAFPDFRAVERTYNMLTQLAGRAGRGDVAGRVVVQTHYPEHYAIRAALEHDDRLFAEQEMEFREAFHYPPFTRMAVISAHSRNRDRAAAEIERLAAALDRERRPGARIAGPAPAPLERLRGQWRFQVVVRSPSATALREMLRRAGADEPRRDLLVDIDPQDLL